MTFLKKNYFKEPFPKIIIKNILFILLMIFALFVIISFGILIHDMGQQEQSQERLFMEEKPMARRYLCKVYYPPEN